jgi:hypothetical protein
VYLHFFWQFLLLFSVHFKLTQHLAENIIDVAADFVDDSTVDVLLVTDFLHHWVTVEEG